MVDAEASQSSDGLSLYQILQTDGALSAVFTEHIRCTHTHKHKATISASSLFFFLSFFKTAVWSIPVI